MVAAKYIPFIGKSTFVKIVKEAVPAVLKLIVELESDFGSVLNLIGLTLMNSSDAQILRWVTLGGIVSNLIDMVDNDGYNGKITF